MSEKKTQTVAINSNGHVGSTIEENEYDFPLSFRRQIIALSLKDGWLASHPGVIKANFFPTKEERRIVSAVLDYQTKYGYAPSLADMQVELSDYTTKLSEVFEESRKPLDKTSELAIEWAKSQAMRLAILDSVQDVDDGNYTSVKARVTDALLVGEDVYNVGSELVDDVAAWSDFSYHSVVASTPWPRINRHLGGGLSPGELGTVVAKTSGYKTMTLVNIGYWAAGLSNGLNVLHITLEMSERKILERYAARTTFKTIGEVGLEKYGSLLRIQAMKKLRGLVRVKAYPTGTATTSQLRDFISLLREKHSFVPGVLIVDYPALMKSEMHYSERRFELKEIYSSLRAMAKNMNIPVWVAAQATRSSFKKFILGTDDVAEDIGISQISDVVLTINQTDDERLVDKMRLYLAKTREDRAGYHIKAEIKYPAIHDRGYVKKDDDEDSDDEE